MPFTLPTIPGSPFLDDVTLGLVPITPPLTQQWGIYDLAGNPVISTMGPGGMPGNIDTFVSLNYDNNAKVSTFPVETGQFASYNKTGTPYSPKVAVAVGGQGRIQTLMELLETELDTTNLYQLITPERTYSKVTLEKYGYVRSQKAGKNLLHVTMTFIQVIEVVPNQYAQTNLPIKNPKKAGAAAVSCHGKTQIAEPNADKLAVNAYLRAQPGAKAGDPGQYNELAMTRIRRGH